jgi:hypothetical protein
MLRILQTFEFRSHWSLDILTFAGAALYALFGYLHAPDSALGNKKRSSKGTLKRTVNIPASTPFNAIHMRMNIGHFGIS